MSTKQTHALRTIAALAFLLLVSIFGQSVATGTPTSGDALTVWVFDVGQGDAIFIDGPDRQVLVDGGPSDVILEKLTAVLPFWDHDIDVLVSTHPHTDHVTGLVHVLERFTVGDVWSSGQDYGTNIFLTFEDMVTETIVTRGDRLDLGGGATLTVLWPTDSHEGDRLSNVHDANVALLLEYGETSMFLAGDMEMEAEEALLAGLEPVDVLKVGHQGSLTSSTPDFLDVLDPTYAIIPVGADNSYGHPHPIVLDRLDRVGAEILRTDLHGDVQIVTDGGEPRVSLFDL